MEVKVKLNDWSPNISSENSTHGFVKFDFDDVHVPGLGKFRVKSEFPRLKPKHERERVDDIEINALCCSLMPWVTENFETSGREDYFKENVLTSALMFFWMWACDDVLEEAIKNKLHFKELKKVTDQYGSVMSGNYDYSPTHQFESVQNYPVFDQLFDSLLQVHNSLKEHLPDYKDRVKKPFNLLQEFFDALVWFSVDEIDGRYSVETFKAFRKVNSFSNGIVQMVAFIRGIRLSDQMWNSLTMKQIEDLVNSIVAFSNDLLGIKKDFLCGVQENLIVFMVLEKKIPLDSAVRHVCELITSALIDYNLLKKAILKEFDCDDDLVKFLNYFDSAIDGLNLIYTEGSRYRIRPGSVSLTR